VLCDDGIGQMTMLPVSGALSCAIICEGSKMEQMQQDPVRVLDTSWGCGCG
jgi:hypothetical protein